MQLNPYLTFDGRCEEAFKFYEKVLGGKIKAMMTYEGSPAAEHTPPEWQKKIMHTTLEVGGEPLMGSDASPKHYSEPKGFAVSLQFPPRWPRRNASSTPWPMAAKWGCPCSKRSGRLASGW